MEEKKKTSLVNCRLLKAISDFALPEMFYFLTRVLNSVLNHHCASHWSAGQLGGKVSE